MHDFNVCPHGPCAGALERAQAVVSRLEELMRRCREERHEVTYADLREVAGGSRAPAAQDGMRWERRHRLGNNVGFGHTWLSWVPCTEEEARRVDGLESWQVRQVAER